MVQFEQLEAGASSTGTSSGVSSSSAAPAVAVGVLVDSAALTEPVVAVDPELNELRRALGVYLEMSLEEVERLGFSKEELRQQVQQINSQRGVVPERMDSPQVAAQRRASAPAALELGDPFPSPRSYRG